MTRIILGEAYMAEEEVSIMEAIERIADAYAAEQGFFIDSPFVFA